MVKIQWVITIYKCETGCDIQLSEIAYCWVAASDEEWEMKWMGGVDIINVKIQKNSALI